MNRHLPLSILAFILLRLVIAQSEGANGKGWHPTISRSLENDDPQPIRSLIGKGFDINVQGNKGETVLTMAASRNKYNVVKLLINEGANLNLQDTTGQSALHHAARGSSAGVMLLLNAQPPANHRLKTSRGLYAAEIAALYGQNESFELFQERSAPFANDLVFSAGLGDLPAMNRFIDSGQLVNATNKSGFTALAVASRAEVMPAMRLLLKKSADPDFGGSTPPLILAAGWHRTNAVKLLIDANAHIDVTNRHGLTALVNAIQVRDHGIVAMLLAAGATVHPMDKSYSPLHEAARTDDIEVIRLLLESGADINAPFYKGGFTPLMIAASENKSRATAYLLTRNARVGAKAEVAYEATGPFGHRTGRMERRKMTALQLAEFNRYDRIVRIFDNPRRFLDQELGINYRLPSSVTVDQWRTRFSEFDSTKGKISRVQNFKRVFGEPTHVSNLSGKLFWHYRCKNGTIQLQVVDPQYTGGQFIVTSVDSISASSSSTGSKPPQPNQVNTNTEVMKSGRSSTPQLPSETSTASSQLLPAKPPSKKQQVSPKEISRREQVELRMLELIGNNPAMKQRLNYRVEEFARKGYMHALAKCLELGADVNSKKFGTTALMAASASGQKEIVEFLIKKGADISLTNSNGQTALQLAKDPEVAAVLKSAIHDSE